jgi:hypothetical protein
MTIPPASSASSPTTPSRAALDRAGASSFI